MRVDCLTFPFNGGKKFIATYFKGCVYNTTNDSYQYELQVDGTRFKKKGSLDFVTALSNDMEQLINDNIKEFNNEIMQLNNELNIIREQYDEQEKAIKIKLQQIVNERTHLISTIFKDVSSSYEETMKANNNVKTYIIRVSENLYKIGRTTQIENRFKSYSDNSLKIIAVKDDNIEKLLHYMLENRRQKGSELFELSESEVKFIIRTYKFRVYEEEDL